MKNKLGQFTYLISFRYKKFDTDLKATEFINTSMTITLDDPVPQPMERSWTTIIREINPTYFHIEIIDVKEIKPQA